VDVNVSDATFFQNPEGVGATGVAAGVQFMPNASELLTLKTAFRTLRRFNSLTVSLQKKGLSFVDVRESFDVVLEDYTLLASHLAMDSPIVHSTRFERALMKLSDPKSILDDDEIEVLAILRKDNATPAHDEENEAGQNGTDNEDRNKSDDEETGVTYFERIRKRAKVKSITGNVNRENYHDLRMIPGTSVTLERLFSSAKHVLTDTRKSTSPILFEAIMMLKINSELWDGYAVAAAMKRRFSEDAFVDDLDKFYQVVLVLAHNIYCSVLFY